MTKKLIILTILILYTLLLISGTIPTNESLFFYLGYFSIFILLSGCIAFMYYRFMGKVE